MNNRIIVIILLSLITSCENPYYYVERFENGNIKEKCEIIDSLKNGKCIKYYEENSKISSITTWENDTLNGIAKYYDSNGELMELYTWENGRKIGPFKKYYNNGNIKIEGNYYLGEFDGSINYFLKDGHLEAIGKYILLEPFESYLNEVIYFNQNGDTNYRKSNYFEIKSVNDTISIGDTLFLEVDLKAPHFSESEMFVYFEIANDTNYYRRLYTDNYVVIYDYFPQKTGEHKIHGVIEEYCKKDDSTPGWETRLYYFDYYYFVK